MRFDKLSIVLKTGDATRKKLTLSYPEANLTHLGQLFSFRETSVKALTTK